MATVTRLPDNKRPAALLQLRIDLESIRPPIWRRVVVPETITLAKLHRVIQIIMGWKDSHMHLFEISGQHYGEPDPEWGTPIHSEARATLAGSLAGAKSLIYTYDFGDDWRHRIKIEKVLPPDPDLHQPICTTARHACPPDDVGGPPGYLDFLDAMLDPNHPEHNSMLEWYGGAFDPEAVDLEAINADLEAIKF